MWFPKIKKILKLNLLKSGLNGGQKGILIFVHVNMNVSHVILILEANWQEIFSEWLINPRPKTESSEVTLPKHMTVQFFKKILIQFAVLEKHVTVEFFCNSSTYLVYQIIAK